MNAYTFISKRNIFLKCLYLELLSLIGVFLYVGGLPVSCGPGVVPNFY